MTRTDADVLERLVIAKNVFDGRDTGTRAEDVLAWTDEAASLDELVLTFLAYGRVLLQNVDTSTEKTWTELCDQLAVCAFKGHPYADVDTLFNQMAALVASVPADEQDGLDAFSTEVQRLSGIRRRRKAVAAFLAAVPRTVYDGGRLEARMTSWLEDQTAPMSTPTRQRLHRLLWFRLLPPGQERLRASADPYVTLQACRGKAYVRGVTEMIREELRTPRFGFDGLDSYERRALRECHALVLLDAACRCADDYELLNKHLFLERDVGAGSLGRALESAVVEADRRWHVGSQECRHVVDALGCLCDACPDAGRAVDKVLGKS